MCGIAGQVVVNGEIAFDRVKKMTDSLRHRGPDDEGVYINEDRTVMFGHQRLSIIDLSQAARQPMTTPDGRFTLIFNGEIYNYQSLREELVSKGIKFKSHSDAEVLLYIWAQKGIECLLNLRGMFAFAIWDEQEKTLTLARDPLGIKPLYYRLVDNQIVFASELKGLRAGGWASQLNPKGIGAFLQWGSIPAPLTIYSGISALPSGHYLQFNQNTGRYNLAHYWSYSQSLVNAMDDNNCPVNDKDAIAFTREALLKSVKDHLVSDVPVGAFLSGGIDSSAVVSLMRQAGQEHIATFSMSFDSGELDESYYAKLVAKQYQTEHYQWKVGKGDFEGLKHGFLDSIDQPTIDGVNTYFVSRFARENGYKVVTSGIGGDEFFYGYDHTFFQLPRMIKHLRKIPADLRRLGAGTIQASRKLGLLNPRWSKLAILLSSPLTLETGYIPYRRLFTPEEVGTFFKDQDFACEASQVRMEDFLPELPVELSTLQKVSVLETACYLGSQLLSDSDVFSMAHSLELRVPLVDRVLSEALAKVDDKWFVDENKTPKALLVNAVGDLPSEVVYRKKQGFTFPLGEWLRQEAWEPNSKMLEEKAVKDVDSRFRAGKTHWSRRWGLEVLDYTLSQL